jgi:hypothetical protein
MIPCSVILLEMIPSETICQNGLAERTKDDTCYVPPQGLAKQISRLREWRKVYPALAFGGRLASRAQSALAGGGM